MTKKKMLILMEIEVSDIPDDARKELVDGFNFNDLSEVPELADSGFNELDCAVREFFSGLQEYEMQQEIWAGSSEYFYISAFDIKSISAA